jgi:hypothetical protein
MAYKAITINPDGGAIKMSITFKGDNVVITYEWNLWESKVNETYYPNNFKGTNLNPYDDDYTLPIPNKDNVGRMIVLDYAVILVDTNVNSNKWTINAELLQDGKIIGNISESDTATDDVSGGSFYIKLN